MNTILGLMVLVGLMVWRRKRKNAVLQTELLTLSQLKEFKELNPLQTKRLDKLKKKFKIKEVQDLETKNKK